MNKLINKVVISLSICTSSILLGNADVSQVEKININEVVKTSKLRSESNNAKVIFDEEQIQQFNDNTAGEVLRRISGVTFSGNPSESKDVRLRGLDKEYTQILINGHRVPGGGEKREFQIDLIPSNMIERIEVIRTPTASIDSQGIAGTINIILKQTPKSRVITASLGLSKLGNNSLMPNASFTYGDKAGDFSYLVSLNAQKRELSKDKTKEKVSAKGENKSGEIEKEEKEYEEIFFATKFNWEVNEKNTLSFNPNYSISKEDKTKTKTKLKSNKLDGLEKESEEKKRTNLGFDLDWQHKLNDDNNLSLRLMLQESKEDKNKIKTAYKKDGKLDKNEIEKEDKTDKEISAKFSGTSLVFANHIIDYGLDYTNKKRDKDKSKIEIKGNKRSDKSGIKDKYSLEENRINAFLQDEYSINDRHIFTPGIRFERVSFESKDASGSGHKNNSSLLNPSLNYLFHISKQDNLKIGIARTVTRPKFDDLNPYVDEKDGTNSKPDKVGNPDLNPETAYGLDIGIEHYFKEDKSLVSANVFYRDIKDKIQKNVLLNPKTNRYEEMAVNQGDAKAYGLELEANYDLSAIIPNLNLVSNITFMDGKITDKKTGKKIPVSDMPDYVYNLGFDYKFLDSYAMGMNYNYVSKREKVSFDGDKRKEEDIEPEKRLDVYLKAKLNSMYSLNFSAKNLLRVTKDKTKRNYKKDVLEGIEYETEKSQRVFTLTLVGKF